MARTKNRFNAVQIPEPVTAGVPVKQRKSFRVALYARLFDVANEKDAEPVYTMVDGLPVLELREAV